MHVDLPDGITAASVARSRTRTVLTGWRMLDLIEPLTLTVSELVGNAVRHGRPPVDMLLRQVGRGVRVEVHDQNPGLPQDLVAPGALPDVTLESGRGAFIVAAMSTSHGVEELPGDGKIVWATVEPESEQLVTPPAGQTLPAARADS